MRSLGLEDTVKAPEEGLKGPAQVSEFPQVDAIEDTPGDGSEGILCPGDMVWVAFDKPLILYGVPTGSRTPVTGVKGRCPRPLDDGDGQKSFRKGEI